MSVPVAEPAAFDLEAVFRDRYGPVARVLARVVRDRGRAEELAVEVFLKLWRTPAAQGAQRDGWLYRTAVRMGLNELRGERRRARCERLLAFIGVAPAPDEITAANEEQARVRTVLGRLGRRAAALLLLRSHGLSYSELAAALSVHPASVGTLLSRAQQAFRKEYIRRYGHVG